MSLSIDSSSQVLENGYGHVELLSGCNDEHEGVIVNMEKPMDSKVFLTALRASLSLWRKQGKRGVWIKLPIGLANLIETAVKEGFCYHHAEPDYLMLVQWISEPPSTIPANATHRVVIGAIVMNDKRELLVVQEKSGKLKGTGIWKIPTGQVDPGEDIFKAAVREVKEETNWMPFEEYTAQPIVQKPGFYKCITDVCLAKVEGDYIGFSPRHVKSSFTDQLSYFYLNKQDSNSS
ncbi:hypothetical protein PVL29_025859 [Vitis rotundifolia]|uniref:Nudix hydrolase domain-containing protein n=1 Tax=Vitis rotundifolia TaxID=103349 RepID=A0AA38YL13_VITRO|nr:hypothetical protein PVL29_025859 [Vitis rotundifolia]